MSDGHSDAGTGVERETDPRDVTDDGIFGGHRLRQDGGKSGGTLSVGTPEWG